MIDMYPAHAFEAFAFAHWWTRQTKDALLSLFD
jgi:hypothetical protein